VDRGSGGPTARCVRNADSRGSPVAFAAAPRDSRRGERSGV
jgi:hypothetical protein